jgi:hypothetical protein
MNGEEGEQGQEDEAIDTFTPELHSKFYESWGGENNGHWAHLFKQPPFSSFLEFWRG